MPDRRSWPAEVFDRIYAGAEDPWNFTTSPYERGKYAAVLAALSGRRFASAFEVGCSIGVLTGMLAPHCDALLAVDVAAAALASARRRCAGLDQVTIRRRQIPGEWPDRRFDLIVLSEVLYFLGPADVAGTAERATASLLPGGMVVLVNWIGPTDTPCTGDEAATLFMAAAPTLTLVGQDRQPQYRLDLLGENDFASFFKKKRFLF